ncbi:MAG: hypothetical protein ACYC27_03215 [Armatimonadota bacterium]
MMLREISYSMTFGAKSNAYSAWNIGASVWTDSSGLAEDSAPALTANIDGTYTASGTIRLPVEADTDAVIASLNELVDNVEPGSSGFIRYHDCYHDEGLPCGTPIVTSWGE